MAGRELLFPIFRSPAALATGLTLSALHCVAAAILIPGLLRPGNKAVAR
jgi:hypothetical protein